jgi:hypothetical protein
VATHLSRGRTHACRHPHTQVRCAAGGGHPLPAGGCHDGGGGL